MALVTYPLGSTVGISLGSAEPKYIDSASVSTEEAAIVESIGVYTSQETLRCSDGELHALLVTRLRD